MPLFFASEYIRLKTPPGVTISTPLSRADRPAAGSEAAEALDRTVTAENHARKPEINLTAPFGPKRDGRLPSFLVRPESLASEFIARGQTAVELESSSPRFGIAIVVRRKSNLQPFPPVLACRA